MRMREEIGSGMIFITIGIIGIISLILGLIFWIDRPDLIICSLMIGGFFTLSGIVQILCERDTWGKYINKMTKLWKL